MYARKFQVCLSDTPYYHVVSRRVRRTWLWGLDDYAGRDYSHRKAWVLSRMSVLTKLFAIDICAYAVMSNHYHLVIRVNPSVAQAWGDAEVVARWSELFEVPPLVERWRRAERVGMRASKRDGRGRRNGCMPADGGLCLVEDLRDRIDGCPGQGAD